jgi:hypothetical protein
MNAIKPPKPLYSMRRLERILGLRRDRLAGLVDGLGIQTYEGPSNSLVIDGDGFRRLEEELGLSAPGPPRP